MPPLEHTLRKRVVGCFVFQDGIDDDSVYLVQRHPSGSYGGTWALPSGRVELYDVDDEAAIRRELGEEIALHSPSHLQYISMHPFTYEWGVLDYVVFFCRAPSGFVPRLKADELVAIKPVRYALIGMEQNLIVDFLALLDQLGDSVLIAYHDSLR